jgi:hypothetical protein
MRRKTALFAVVVLGSLVTAWVGHARAQGTCPSSPSSTDALWTVPTGAAGVFPPSSDTPFSPLGSTGRTFTAAGTNLYAVDDATGLLYSGWSVNPLTFAQTIQNFVIPVVLKGNTAADEVIFLANTDGRLYKVSAMTGVVLDAPRLTRDTCLSDQLMATPAVWLYNDSSSSTLRECTGNTSSAFHCRGIGASPARSKCTSTRPGQNPNCYCQAGGDDLVFVITRHMCSDTADNEVFALCASDLTYFWEYQPNAIGDGGMDFASDGAFIDYDADAIYYGTHGSGTQKTLWSVDMATGMLKQGRNVGSITTRPHFKLTDAGTHLSCGSSCPFLYVGTDTGTLRVYDATSFGTGAAFWTLPLATSQPFRRSVWAEFRGGGYGSMILSSVNDPDALDGNLVKGFMKVVVDHSNLPGTPGGTLAWSDRMSIGGVSGQAAVSPALGKGYVGTIDGLLHQFELSTDSIDATAHVSGGGTVGDVTLDLSTSSSTVADRLMVNAGGNLKAYCTPWVNGNVTTSVTSPPGPEAAIVNACAADADCQGTGDPCSNVCQCSNGGTCLTTETQPFCTCPSPAGPPETCYSCPPTPNQNPQYCDGHGLCRTPWEGGCKKAACDSGNCHAVANGAVACTNGNPLDCDPAYVLPATARCTEAPCPVAPDGTPLCDRCYEGSLTCEGLHSDDACRLTGGPGCDAVPGTACCGPGRGEDSGFGECQATSTPACTDIEKDRCNCGGCGHSCLPGEVCTDGVCVPS